MDERIEEVARSAVEAIRSIDDIDVRRIILFGSRARGDNRNGHADIDIGIVASRPLTRPQLTRVRERINDIETLFSVDVVDFSGRDDAFSQEALKHTEVLYEKK